MLPKIVTDVPCEPLINDRQFLLHISIFAVCLKFLAVPTLLRLQFDYLICCFY